MKRLLLISISLILLNGTGFSQFSADYKYVNMNPSIGIGIGTSNYYGELNQTDKVSSAKASSFGMHLLYNHPLSPSVYGRATLNYHNLSQWGVDSSLIRNFHTRTFGADIGAFYRLDNDIVLSQQSSLTVFAGGGFGITKLNVKEDQLGASGEHYNYWSDGTIRNLPEGDTSAVSIYRDYDYETDITSNKSFALYLYLEGGFGLKITSNLLINLSYKHAFTFSDNLDGLNSNDKNDRFDYFNITGVWSFGEPYRTADEILRDKAAETIDLSDQDGDDVADIDDLCAKTPYGWEVDIHGCPLDSDGDKVPDAIDKEPNSASGAVVNEEGITLTEVEIEIIYLLQTNQMGGHEKFEEWKAKYPELFNQYYGKSSKNSSSSEDE